MDERSNEDVECSYSVRKAGLFLSDKVTLFIHSFIHLFLVKL